MMQNKFYSPLRYPGGKNCIFPFVSRLIKENNLLSAHYAEPFAGGAGLALRLLYEGYVDEISLNDFDYVIYSFWTAAVKHNEELCSWVHDITVSIDTWYKYKEIINNPNKYMLLDVAKATLFINRTNVSGVLKGGIIGGLRQEGKNKIDCRFNKKSLIDKLQMIEMHKQRIHISSMDGIDFLNMLNNSDQNIFFYLDPPYYKKGRNMYLNFYRDIDHINLAEKVKELRKKWIMSYDYHDFILKLYQSQKSVLYSLYQRNSNRIGSEVLIFDDCISFHESITHLKSATIINPIPSLCWQR